MTIVRVATLRAALVIAASVAAAPALVFASTTRPCCADSTARSAPDPSRTLGIVPFDVDEKDTLLAPLAYGLPDLLTTDLARSKRLTLVERARLGAILRELDLARSGAVLVSNAPRVGRLTKAQRLITGSLRQRAPRSVVVEARVNDAVSGEVLQTLTAVAPLDDILAAEKEVALRMFDYLGIVLTPQERALVVQRPTRNVSALLAYGQGAKEEVNGQYSLALRSFHRAAQIDPGFSSATTRERSVRETIPNSALAGALNRVNRPLDAIPTTLQPGIATDPAFPAARATVVVTISRP